MALEGVIYAMQSEIGIDGDTMITKNWAEADGGEKERETWIVLKTMLSTTTVVLASTVLVMLEIKKTKHETDWLFLPSGYIRHECRQMAFTRTTQNTYRETIRAGRSHLRTVTTPVVFRYNHSTKI